MQSIARAFSYMSEIIQDNNCSNKFSLIDKSNRRLYPIHIVLLFYDNERERERENGTLPLSGKQSYPLPRGNHSAYVICEVPNNNVTENTKSHVNKNMPRQNNS